MLVKAVQIGNPIVRAKSKPVTRKELGMPTVKKLIRDLTDSMRHYGLVGMAAPQIGVNLRVFVSEVRKTDVRKNISQDDSLRVFINPRIVSMSKKKTELVEGCGSVAYAQLFGPVARPAQVTVAAFDENGKLFTLVAKDILAKVVQHEIDHLDGILCIDKFSSTKQIRHKEEYKTK